MGNKKIVAYFTKGICYNSFTEGGEDGLSVWG